MASEVLYVITGVVLVVMAAHRLLEMRVGPYASLNHGASRRDFIHDAKWMLETSLFWSEGALCVAFLFFGIWLMFTASHSLF